MSSGLPSFQGGPRIVPFRSLAGAPPAVEPSAPASAYGAPVPASASPPAPGETRRDAARHYLKFMLPSIPVMAFIATFVLCYLVRADALDPVRTADPTVPFLAALLLGAITGALCMVTYFGYVRISGSMPHG